MRLALSSRWYAFPTLLRPSFTTPSTHLPHPTSLYSSPQDNEEWLDESNEWSENWSEDWSSEDDKDSSSSSSTPPPSSTTDPTDDLFQDLEEQYFNSLQELQSSELETIENDAAQSFKVEAMLEAGLKPSVVSEITGKDTTSDASSETDRMISSVISTDTVNIDSALSYEKVPLTSGIPSLTRFIYVDEETCIGCTHCASYSPSTFYMEPDHGRARVFEQWGDEDDVVGVAVETCPVDCIHYVGWEELVELERERENIDINFKERLVSDNVRVKANLSANKGLRCNNCPSRGCKNCPMFGVGDEVWERQERERKTKDIVMKEKGDKKADL